MGRLLLRNVLCAPLATRVPVSFPLRLLHGKFVSGADARRDYPEDRKIHGPFRVGGW